MLSNAYFLAKFRFDTAENEPAKKFQNFANFPNFANPSGYAAAERGGGLRGLPPRARPRAGESRHTPAGPRKGG